MSSIIMKLFGNSKFNDNWNFGKWRKCSFDTNSELNNRENDFEVKEIEVYQVFIN